MSFPEAYWFQSSEEIPGLFESFFGGFFLIKGLPLIFQLTLLFFYALTWFLAWRSTQRPNAPLTAVRLSGFVTLTLGAVLLLQPWDELFVNLKHSYNLAHHSRFSFNLAKNVEGTVDFLPLFLVGLLGKIGFPLLETLFLFCLAGGWACVEIGVRILRQWQIPLSPAWTYPMLLLFPPLYLNCSHGFSTSIFTALILVSIYWREKNPRSAAGWLCLSLVPLTRAEGIWLVILVGAWNFYSQRTWRSLIPGFLSALPFALLSWGRLIYFGSAVPVPIQYKATLGSLFYLLMGLRNLLADLTGSFSLLFLASILLFGIPPRLKKSAGATLVLLILFILPYYSSGGDWFPAAWGRYLFPLAFFSLLMCIGAAAENPDKRKFGILFLIALPFWGLPFSSLDRIQEDLFYPRRVLARLSLKKQGRGNYRMQYLSQLGTHLKRTTPSSITIASSEIATVMYFAERDTLDLLGVANPEIAREPVREVPSLIRKFPSENELPYLIFKRLQPDLIPRHQPEIIYTFDFFVTEILEGVEPEEIGVSELKTAFRRWERRFQALHGPLYGGLPKLSEIGYRPIIIQYAEDYFSVYLVAPDFLEEHLGYLRDSGMKETILRLQE